MIAHVLGVTQIALVLQHVTWKCYYKIFLLLYLDHLSEMNAEISNYIHSFPWIASIPPYSYFDGCSGVKVRHGFTIMSDSLWI